MNTLLEHRIGGSITSALSHLFPVGLAGILEESGCTPVRWWWTDEAVSGVVLACPLGLESIAEVVLRHATRHAGPESWVSARINVGDRSGTALFSPRVKPPALGDWDSYSTERNRFLERAQHELTALDWRMIGALGEPAWWMCNSKESKPDSGASRWEMKTRNQGQEFVSHRLSPLAAAVTARSIASVISSLTGVHVVDEVGSDRADSRTPTGLTPPGPTDNVVAWCALWGIAALPTLHAESSPSRARGMSQSAGTWPRHRVHPAMASLPVFSVPTSVSHLRAVMLSRAFDVAAFPSTDAIFTEGEREQLRQQGLRAIIRFPAEIGGSPSAPERVLLAGSIEAL